MARAHRMAALVPGVEIAHHRHRARVRRPHREAHAGDALDRHRPRPKRERQLEMPALVEQMQVEGAEQHAERIRVLGLLRPRPAIGYAAGRARARTRPANNPTTSPCVSSPRRRRPREQAPPPAPPPAEHATAPRRHAGRAPRTDRPSGLATGPRRARIERRDRRREGAIHHSAAFRFVASTVSAIRASPCNGTSIHVGRLAAS